MFVIVVCVVKIMFNIMEFNISVMIVNLLSIIVFVMVDSCEV